MTNSNGDFIQRQITEIHARIDGMDRDFTNRASIILDEVLVQQQQMESLTGQVDQLTDQVRYLTSLVDRVTGRVDQLADRVDQLAQIQEITQSHVSQLAVTIGAVCSKYRSRSRNYTGNACRHPRYPDGKPTVFTPFIWGGK